tara:strand:- start:22 stop:237 length:216 start_codon:yes stop_codon:yes gene_type:complete
VTSAKKLATDAALRNLLRKNPGRVFTQQEIADAAGISRQAVSKTEMNALKKIRRLGGQTLSELLLELRKEE